MSIKEQFKALRSELLASNDPDRKTELFNQLQDLMASGGEEAAEAYRESLEASADRIKEASLRQSVEFIRECLSLSYVARRYFGKTHAWLSQRINGNIVNGKPAQFTEQERETFKAALRDISARIMKVVDEI